MRKALVFIVGIVLAVITSFVILEQTNLLASDSVESYKIVQKYQPSENTGCPYLNSAKEDMAQKSGKECPYLKGGDKNYSDSCPYLKNKKHLNESYSL